MGTVAILAQGTISWLATRSPFFDFLEIWPKSEIVFFYKLFGQLKAEITGLASPGLARMAIYGTPNGYYLTKYPWF